MNDLSLRAWLWARGRMTVITRSQLGEGVVSSAIAVLIFAALGAVMWLGFKTIWGNASTQTADQIKQIGQ